MQNSKSSYKDDSTEMVVGDAFPGFFLNKLEGDCPLVSCTLLNSGCITSYDGKNVIIDEKG